MRIETEEYMTIQRREEVRAEARKLRKQFLRYKEAEIVYSMQHKKLLELADRAGALYGKPYCKHKNHMMRRVFAQRDKN